MPLTTEQRKDAISLISKKAGGARPHIAGDKDCLYDNIHITSKFEGDEKRLIDSYLSELNEEYQKLVFIKNKGAVLSEAGLPPLEKLPREELLDLPDFAPKGILAEYKDSFPARSAEESNKLAREYIKNNGIDLTKGMLSAQTALQKLANDRNIDNDVTRPEHVRDDGYWEANAYLTQIQKDMHTVAPGAVSSGTPLGDVIKVGELSTGDKNKETQEALVRLKEHEAYMNSLANTVTSRDTTGPEDEAIEISTTIAPTPAPTLSNPKPTPTKKNPKTEEELHNSWAEWKAAGYSITITDKTDASKGFGLEKNGKHCAQFSDTGAKISNAWEATDAEKAKLIVKGLQDQGFKPETKFNLKGASEGLQKAIEKEFVNAGFKLETPKNPLENTATKLGEEAVPTPFKTTPVC